MIVGRGRLVVYGKGLENLHQGNLIASSNLALSAMIKKFFFYLIRAICVGLCCFFGLFILEGFDPQFGWQSGIAHAIPTLIMISITILVWKWTKLKK